MNRDFKKPEMFKINSRQYKDQLERRLKEYREDDKYGISN